MESSQTRDQTHVPSIGRWILNHWITREFLRQVLSKAQLTCTLTCQCGFTLKCQAPLFPGWDDNYPNPSNKQLTQRGSIFVHQVLYRWFVMTQKCSFHLLKAFPWLSAERRGKICHHSFLFRHLNFIEKETWWQEWHDYMLPRALLSRWGYQGQWR